MPALAALLLALSPARAASLDMLEVGGPWGTPTADNPAALWWNPAGIAAGGGHQLLLEGAPIFGTVDFQRADPHGGPDTLHSQGLLPFAGVSSDLTVPGLGVGAALAVPMVRGGESTVDGGSGRYHLQFGDIRKIHLILGGGYSWQDRIAAGASVHFVSSSWTAELYNDTMVDLHDQIEELGQQPDEEIYNDANLENERYATLLELGPLTGSAVTWSVGIRGSPHEMVDVALSYMAPYRIDHAGEGTLAFSCPPQEDTLGRFGAEDYGICDVTLNADATIGYDLPGRILFGVAVDATENLRIEGFGGVVTWSRFQDFEIGIGSISEKNELSNPEAAELVEQQRLWARANEDTWFGGLDAKGWVTDRVLLGGRILYDKSAIPDEALSVNNYDANTTMLSGLVSFKVAKPVQLGLSATQFLSQERTVTTSNFGMTLDEASRHEDRWFYPHMNGTYTSSITRFGISLKADF